jgi:hypothetical protein
MTECSICHEALDDFAYVKLVCNHEFHQKCIFKWISQKNECPFCKTAQYEPDPISPEDLAIVNELVDNRVNQIVTEILSKLKLRELVLNVAGITEIIALLVCLYCWNYLERKIHILQVNLDFELPMTGIKYQTCYPDMLAYYASKLMDLS